MTATKMAPPTGRADSEYRELRNDVRKFLEAEIRAGTFAPHCDSWMAGFDPAFSARVGEQGWLGMVVPTAYGGHGRSPLERLVVAEEMLAHGAPVAAHWIADRQTAPNLLKFGTEEQKERYLPGITSGTTFFAIGMSEPDAGSDLASVRTKAVEDGDSWRLTGTKVWTTGAHLAHAMIVLARTDTDASGRHGGLSQFVVDLPNPNIEIRPIRSIDGAAHFNEVVFRDAKIPRSALLGTRADGWVQVMSELAFERSGPERYLSTMPLLRSWAERLRVQGATPEQRVALGMLTSRAWTLRRMSLIVATELAAGRSPDVMAAMVKDLGSTFEGDLVDVVRRSSGVAARLHTEDPFAELLAHSLLHTPAFTLRGGTNEILRSIIGRGMGLR